MANTAVATNVAVVQACPVLRFMRAILGRADWRNNPALGGVGPLRGTIPTPFAPRGQWQATKQAPRMHPEARGKGAHLQEGELHA
jgi:hypothetical protein